MRTSCNRGSEFTRDGPSPKNHGLGQAPPAKTRVKQPQHAEISHEPDEDR